MRGRSRHRGDRVALATCSVWLVSLAASAWGCLPPVIHGPRVDDGLAIGGSLSTTTGPTYTEGDFGGVHLRQGHIGLHASYGWASASPSRPGFFAGIAVPVLYSLATVDVFMQLPPKWTRTLSAGVGAGGGFEDRQVYAQLGRVSDAGRGWFITQGVGQRPRSGSRGSSTVSVSGAALQFTRRSLRTYVHLQYAYGREPGSCVFGDALPCTRGPRSHSVSLGTTLEGRRPRRP